MVFIMRVVYSNSIKASQQQSQLSTLQKDVIDKQKSDEVKDN